MIFSSREHYPGPGRDAGKAMGTGKQRHRQEPGKAVMSAAHAVLGSNAGTARGPGFITTCIADRPAEPDPQPVAQTQRCVAEHSSPGKRPAEMRQFAFVTRTVMRSQGGEGLAVNAREPMTDAASVHATHRGPGKATMTATTRWSASLRPGTPRRRRTSCFQLIPAEHRPGLPILISFRGGALTTRPIAHLSLPDVTGPVLARLG